jgi:putative peptide zinc metalloprotease protein
MPAITPETKVTLRPLSQQIENGVVVLGYANEFLELPAEGVTFLAWLNEGLTLNAARKRFEQQVGPFSEADLLEMMDAFLESDFIAVIDGQSIPARNVPTLSSPNPFPKKWAAALFSTPMLIAWLLFVIPAVTIWVATPAFWPRYTDFFWHEYLFVVVAVGLLVWLSNMALHELSHWVACQAKGIEATITWTQRLGYIPMSQTIMHNVWAVPRTSRFIPLAAGMMFDFVRISVVLYLLFFEKMGYVALPLLFIQFLKFNLLSATIGVTTQFWLFSRMDGYFLLSALLGQRNLQADTYSWLRSKVSKVKEFTPPAAGMKYIYIYLVITLIGGGFIVGSFLLVTLPIQLQLLWQSFLKIGDPSVGPVAYADGVAVVASQLINYSLLLYAYWREALPEWGRNWGMPGRLLQWINIRDQKLGEAQ